MKRVYLLLRNNIQSGPYSIDELLQQTLQPSDLVWIEGESHFWASPSDIDLLDLSTGKMRTGQSGIPIKQSIEVSSTTSTNSNEPYTEKDNGVKKAPLLASRLPVDEFEKKAEELKRRAESVSATRRFKPTPVKPEDGRFTYLAKEEPIEVTFHTKRKNSVTFSELIAVALVTALFAAAWYGRDELFNQKNPAASTAAIPLIFNQEQPVTTKNQLPTDGSMNELENVQQLATQISYQKSNFNRAVAITEKQELVTVDPATTLEPAATTAAGDEAVVIVTPVPNPVEETDKKEPLVSEPTDNIAGTTETATVQKQKRKILGRALKNIFRKKRKADEPAVSQTADLPRDQ